MNMFESLLLFIRATRQQRWELHSEILHALVAYFFAFDMLNISNAGFATIRYSDVEYIDARKLLRRQISCSIYSNWSWSRNRARKLKKLKSLEE